MNYNNYGQFGYNGYPYQNQQVAQPTYQQQSLNNYNNFQGMQMQQTPRSKCDYLAISNVEEVKSYLMQPNTTVLFKDVNNKMIYEKKTDSQGISEIKVYQETILNNNEYVRQQDFISFKNDLENRLNNLANNNQKTITNEILN
jgi:hypothetical protein